MLYDSIYIKFEKVQKNIWCLKIFQWLPRAEVWEGWEGGVRKRHEEILVMMVMFTVDCGNGFTGVCL